MLEKVAIAFGVKVLRLRVIAQTLDVHGTQLVLRGLYWNGLVYSAA